MKPMLLKDNTAYVPMGPSSVYTWIDAHSFDIGGLTVDVVDVRFEIESFDFDEDLHQAYVQGETDDPVYGLYETDEVPVL